MKDLLGRIKVALNEQGYPLRKDSYHFVTRIFKPVNRVERTLFQLIFQSAYQSEIMSAGSAYLSLQFAIAFIEQLLKHPELIALNDVELLQTFEDTAEKFKVELTKYHSHLREDELRAELRNISEDQCLSEVLEEALLVSGLEGKIHVEDGLQSNYTIEQKSGYLFGAVKPFKFMLPPSGLWEAKNCKVMLVDGVLERVSELDKILNKSLETKVPMLLIAHGFSEEVATTLKMNMDAGKLNIMPVRLVPDLDSLNVINDIAVVAGGDIISTLKGQMVIFTDYDTLPTVELVRLNIKELNIENGRTRAGVSQHLRMLLEKRNVAGQVEDLEVLIDKRIQSLISAAVTVRLPNMAESQRSSTKVKIDVALRTAKTLLNYGVVDLFTTVYRFKPTTTMDRMVRDALAQVGAANRKDQIPFLSAYLGMYFVGKTVLSMLTSNGLVEITD